MIDLPLPALDLPVPAAMPGPLTAIEPETDHYAAPAALELEAREAVPQAEALAAPPVSPPDPAEVLVAQVSRPISEVMERTLWTVHAEDSIDQVETFMAQQSLTAVPVVGSNGAIIGMIGAPELAQFLIDGKNPKAVQAWEISRIRSFEVSPGDSVEDVAKLMAENKIENISVTEFGRLQGVVTTQDLLQDILRVIPH